MKRVSFTSKPPAGIATPDQWVAAKAADVPTKRLTIDVPVDLHRRMKVQCALTGEHMADVVRTLLEAKFRVREDEASALPRGREVAHAE
jgi:hypothetical protein